MFGFVVYCSLVSCNLGPEKKKKKEQRRGCTLLFFFFRANPPPGLAPTKSRAEAWGLISYVSIEISREKRGVWYRMFHVGLLFSRYHE